MSYTTTTSSDELLKFVADNKDTDKGYLVYMTGALREDGTSWCPDCVETKDECAEMMEKFPGAKMKATVTRDDWLGKPHPFKVDAQIKASGVPNVFVFRGT